jgi:hypothetical protein
MTFFKNLVAMFASVVLCVCSVNSARRTPAERLNGADVLFSAKQNGNWLTLVGKERGRETFRRQVSSSDFGLFDKASGGSFRIKGLENAILWQYQSEEEFFQITVDRYGNIFLGNSPRTYTGFDRRKTYAFETGGVLENHGDQAFYDLVVSANQVHNYGIVQSFSCYLSQNYFYNAGVIKLGESPIAVKSSTQWITVAGPAYKQNVVENYGQLISKEELSVEGGLDYRELGESVMNDLRMSGGDISVFKGSMSVAGTLSGDVGRIAVIDGTSSMYVHRFERVPGDVRGVNGGVLYIPDEEKARLERLELEKETALRNRLGDTIYDRYVRIKNGELLTEPERQSYKARYGRRWAEEAARLHRWGLRGGGNVVGAVAAVGIGALVGSSGHHGGSVSVGVGSSGNVQVRATNNRAYRDTDFDNMARQHAQQRQEYDNRNRVVLEQSMNRASLYRLLRDYTPTHRGVTNPVTRIRQVFEVSPVEAENRRRLYGSIGMRSVRGPDMQPFLAHMREQMWAFRVPQPYVQDVLGDRTITDALYRIRQFNDYTMPSSSGTEVLRSLQRDAEADRGWFQRHFNPTREEVLERAARMAQPNFVERLVFEHPWIALGPAGLMFKPIHTAGAMALQRVAPMLLAATEVGNSIYENLINYAKGGKDAVGKGGSGAGRGGRVTREYGKGKYWEGLKTKSQDSRLIAISRKAKADIRMDQDGFFYKFDPAHKTAKVHLHKYRDLGSNRYRLIEEVDPVNGVGKVVTDGGVEIW